MQVVDPGARPGAGSASFTAKEWGGYVKEYIEQEGAAMILSKELGLVLFNLDSVWMDGKQSQDRRRAKDRLEPGREVTLLVRSFHGEEYKDLSEDKPSTKLWLSGWAGSLMGCSEWPWGRRTRGA